MLETQVAVSVTTPTSNKAPFSYTGVSLPAVGDEYIVASATPILPSTDDSWIAIAVIQSDKKIRVYANSSANFLVRVTYKKS